MNEINWISLYIVVMLINIRLEYLFLAYPPSLFPTLMHFLFYAYFVLHKEFLLLLLIDYGFTTHGEPAFKKDSGIL